MLRIIYINNTPEDIKYITEEMQAAGTKYVKNIVTGAAGRTDIAYVIRSYLNTIYSLV